MIMSNDNENLNGGPDNEPYNEPETKEESVERRENIKHFGEKKLSPHFPMPILLMPFSEEDLKKLENAIESNETLNANERRSIWESVSEHFTRGYVHDSDQWDGGYGPTIYSDSTNGVDANNRSMSATRSVKTSRYLENETVSGTKAMMSLKNAHRSGVPLNIICYNSGINLTVSGFSNAEVFSLIELLRDRSMQLGYKTMGLVLTGDDCISNEIILDSVIRRLTTASVKIGNDSNRLYDLILANDIPIILSAILTSLYPDGYPIIHNCVKMFNQECTPDTAKYDEKSNMFEYQDMIDFKTLVYPRSSVLSDDDMQILHAAPASVEIDKVISYQERREVSIPALKVKISDKETLEISLRQPNLTTYFDEGRKYIDEVIKFVDGIITKNNNARGPEIMEARKNKLIEDYSNTASLASLIAWIKELRIVDSEGHATRFDKREDIMRVLVEEFRIIGKDNLKKHFAKFKDSNNVAPVGVENFKCAKCGADQAPDNTEYESLIPINLTPLFLAISEWNALLTG